MTRTRSRPHTAFRRPIVEQLTLPDVFTEAEREHLVMAAADRIVAAEWNDPDPHVMLAP
ncbi:hypothetical protein [Streptomyces sp. NPDC051001]|uniref:hypothetical protein n=1 Tax=Streptomyces sp. NPDC051001 TaxID=3155795 RepID=UPI00343524F4